MARNGLLYYNIDTDRYDDIRIRKLKRGCGLQGLAVYDYLLLQIYKDKGYYLLFDEDTLFFTSEWAGVKENAIQEIVNLCCAVGLFNKELYTSARVLTSKAIQTRYLKACKNLKRTDIQTIDASVNLLTDTPIRDKTPKPTEEMQFYTDKTPKPTEENALNYINIKERKEIKESVCVTAHTRVTPTAASGVHTQDFIFEIERAFFLRGYKYPQRIAKEMMDYYVGEGKDLANLPLAQAVAKVTNWNPKNPKDYPKMSETAAKLFVELVDRMPIGIQSKQTMLEEYRDVDICGNTIEFSFGNPTVAAAFRTYCKNYSDLLAKISNGNFKFIEAR